MTILPQDEDSIGRAVLWTVCLIIALEICLLSKWSNEPRRPDFQNKPVELR